MVSAGFLRGTARSDKLATFAVVLLVTDGAQGSLPSISEIGLRNLYGSCALS